MASSLKSYCANGLGFLGKDQFAKTPEKLYQFLDREFHFTFDPCPVDPKMDGLEVPWGKSNYVNPPYKFINKWFSKALKERQRDPEITSVFLIPFRPHTKYYMEDIIPNCSEVRFFRKRFAFQGYTRALFTVVVIVLPAIARDQSSIALQPIRSSSSLFDKRFKIINFKTHEQPNTVDGFVNILNQHQFQFDTINIVNDKEEIDQFFNTTGSNDPLCLVTRHEVQETIDKASLRHSETGTDICLCVPLRPEAKYFLPHIMFGDAAHVISTYPTLILQGFETKCPTGSVFLIWTKNPCDMLYNNDNPPRFSVIEDDFHERATISRN